MEQISTIAVVLMQLKIRLLYVLKLSAPIICLKTKCIVNYSGNKQSFRTLERFYVKDIPIVLCPTSLIVNSACNKPDLV